MDIQFSNNSIQLKGFGDESTSLRKEAGIYDQRDPADDYEDSPTCPECDSDMEWKNRGLFGGDWVCPHCETKLEDGDHDVDDDKVDHAKEWGGRDDDTSY